MMAGDLKATKPRGTERMDVFEKTKRSKVVRAPKRGHYDRETINAIIDDAIFCHVGFVSDGKPAVIPINHWRIGDQVFFHGSSASRLIGVLCNGEDVCVTVTHLDGLVLARSAFHYSVNYRSAVIFGRAHEVVDEKEKMSALEALIERVSPGRWAEIRIPNAIEMKATRVAALPLTEASAKVRSGPPIDDEDDYALPVWAGIVPLETRAGTPLPDDRLAAETPLPAYLRNREDG
jgi:uncharacterized protein